MRAALAQLERGHLARILRRRFAGGTPALRLKYERFPVPSLHEGRFVLMR